MPRPIPNPTEKHYPAQCLIRCDTVFLQRIQPLIYQNIPIRTPRHIRQHPTIPRRLQQTGIIRSQRPSSRCRNHEPIFRHRPARKKGLVEKGWQQALPDHAAPYTSTMVFLVRKTTPNRSAIGTTLPKTALTSSSPRPRATDATPSSAHTVTV